MSEVKSALTAGTGIAKSGCQGTIFRFITRRGIGNRTHGTESPSASRLELQKSGYNGSGPPKRSRVWSALQGGKYSRSNPPWPIVEQETVRGSDHITSDGGPGFTSVSALTEVVTPNGRLTSSHHKRGPLMTSPAKDVFTRFTRMPCPSFRLVLVSATGLSWEPS